MYSFRNDYSETAHPNILNRLIETNIEYGPAYGGDDYCKQAADLIRTQADDPSVDVHLLVGGTQTNLVSISSFLRPHEAVIATDTAHISTHETGAIEATGHKILAVPNKDGKLTPDQIERQLALHPDEHMVKPRLVKISNSTELGTIYSKDELIQISDCCRRNNLLLYLDGARLGAALTAPNNTLSIAEICALTDAFYIGGTKNGAMLGEALIIRNETLKPDFRYMIKQKGALFAKSRALGIQFVELFKESLFFDLAKNANAKAAVLREAIQSAGYPFLVENTTNQVFPILPNTVMEALKEDFVFEFWANIDDTHTAVRLVTSWATTDEAVNAFAERLKQLSVQ